MACIIGGVHILTGAQQNRDRLQIADPRRLDQGGFALAVLMVWIPLMVQQQAQHAAVATFGGGNQGGFACGFLEQIGIGFFFKQESQHRNIACLGRNQYSRFAARIPAVQAFAQQERAARFGHAARLRRLDQRQALPAAPGSVPLRFRQWIAIIAFGRTLVARVRYLRQTLPARQQQAGQHDDRSYPCISHFPHHLSPKPVYAFLLKYNIDGVMSLSTVRILILVIAGLAAAPGVYVWWRQIAPEAATATGTASIGGPFTLTDHHGARVTEKLLQGRLSLIYFGYASCPDVCPTELQTMGAALDLLAASDAKKIQDVQGFLITVDPARDSVAALADYMSNFHPALSGLTGSAEEIAAAAKVYRVYYSKAEAGSDPQSYLMDHSNIIYLMGRDGQFLAHFGMDASAEQIAAKLREFQK